MERVLVVDDAQDNIALLTYDLEEDGFEVVHAHNGAACLKLALTDPQPDIILLDLHMPVLNGIETLKKLKSHSRTEAIPVIMISVEDADKRIIEAIDLGAHDYVSKPISYPTLAARMRSALRLAQALKALEIANQALNKLATIDALTDSYNRRYFLSLAEKEAEKSHRHGRSLAVMMLDIDHFKHINDSYGHISGDHALEALARCIRDQCRNSDIVGRIGGEEFALCCPDADLHGAKRLAERIRSTCSKMKIMAENTAFSITVSIGVTLLTAGEKFDEALHRADLLLYQAKNTGRNKSIAAIESPTRPH